MEEFGDNASIIKSNSTVSDKDFLVTMAQITDALQKLPLHTSSGYYSPKVAPLIGNSASDQQMKSRRSLLNSTELENTLEVSSSMMIPSLKNSDDSIQFSEKERHLLQMTKASSVQLMEHSSPPKLFTNKSDECAPTLLKQGLIEMTTSDLTGGYYDFSSCLQSRIDAQIVELARARSKNKSNRSPRNNLVMDKPTVMI
ncbi:hypothetical protein BDF21DRAFT_205273 [Thamnidium elegans]|nr:hypothetical protein BDF21DRAFT_205273 [Thamnidium elegans]